MLQMGYDQSSGGRGPLEGYLYYYLNEPHILGSSDTMRVALAPVYLDSELGIHAALGPKTDLGLGLAGGGFADSYDEIRRGIYLRGESFNGDGATASVGVYHAFPKIGPVPLEGILRARAHYMAFSANSTTEPSFTTPRDQVEIIHRAGLRLGGVEPTMLPKMAAELSIWNEGRYRTVPGTYGYGGVDRTLQADTQLFWARALLVFNKPESANRFIIGLTAGESVHPDRLSAYRLGGVMPAISEYPLVLPGYYWQEVSARAFGLLGGTYIIPLSADRKTWTALPMASTALVNYAPGLDQKGHTQTGVGMGLSYLSHSRAWKILGGYGYGIDAIREGGRGGQMVGLLVQFDFQRAEVPFFHPIDPQEGLQHLLQ